MGGQVFARLPAIARTRARYCAELSISRFGPICRPQVADSTERNY